VGPIGLGVIQILPVVCGSSGLGFARGERFTLVGSVFSVEGMVQGAIEGVGPGLLPGVWSPDEGDRSSSPSSNLIRLPIR
jgi:hypothetical protein